MPSIGKRLIHKALILCGSLMLMLSAVAADFLATRTNANAQYNLGLMYEEGEGIRQNYNMAMKWYQDSADQDDADAQYRIGVLYAQGKGVTKNKQQAQQWYQVACNNGNSRSCTAYSKLPLNQ